MSHATTDRNHSGPTRPDAHLDGIHSSNLTSGHFLGTVPRGWMINNEGSYVTPSRTGQNLVRLRPLKPRPTAATVQQRSTVEGVPGTNPEQALILALPPNTVQSSTSSASPTLIQTNELPTHRNGTENFTANQAAFHQSDSNGQSVQALAAPQPAQAMDYQFLQANAQVSFNPNTYTSRTLPMSNTPLNAEYTNLTNNVYSAPPAQQNIHGPRIVPTTGSTTTYGPGNYSVARGSPMVISGPNSNIRSSNMRSPLSSAAPLASQSIMPLPQTSSSFSQTSLGFLEQPLPSTGFIDSSPTVQQSMLNYQQILNWRIAAISARQPLSMLDISRIRWLRTACEFGDMFFLLVHRLTCIQSANPRYLISDLSFSPSHIQGLTLMNYILADSQLVTSELLLTFCDFATPDNFFATDENVRIWMPTVVAFLDSVTSRWEELRIKVFARGFPPTAREIAKNCSIDTPVLPEAIFGNLFHQLFVQGTNGFAQDMLQVFRSSQHVFLNDKEPAYVEREAHTYIDLFKSTAQRHNQRPATTLEPLYSILQPGRPIARTVSVTPRAMIQPAPANADRLDPNGSHWAEAVSVALTVGSSPVTSHTSNTSYLFPPPGRTLPITVNPDSNRCALHQAHLVDSPIQFEGRETEDTEDQRVYSFVESHIGELGIIDDETVFETWPVTVSSQMIERKVRETLAPESNPFGRATRIVRNGSIAFHLRCVRISKTQQPADESVYCVMATSWPVSLFISINGTHLEFRRKVLHGKDLPVDVTHLIEKEHNEVQLSYHATEKEKGKSFAIILEAINMLDQKAALELTSSIDAEGSLAAIVRSLQTTTEDDDVAVTDTYVSIDLIDPFTARIFDTPVRGSTCRHRECFDRESYLQTRSCRNKDGLIHPDEWKCPICGKDARPTSLVIDHFLLQVRERLFADGKADTKAILVKEDGSWAPKENKENKPNSDAVTVNQNIPPSRSNSGVQAPTVAAKVTTDSALPYNDQVPAGSEPSVIVLDDDEMQ